MVSFDRNIYGTGVRVRACMCFVVTLSTTCNEAKSLKAELMQQVPLIRFQQSPFTYHAIYLFDNVDALRLPSYNAAIHCFESTSTRINLNIKSNYREPTVRSLPNGTVSDLDSPHTLVYIGYTATLGSRVSRIISKYRSLPNGLRARLSSTRCT